MKRKTRIGSLMLALMMLALVGCPSQRKTSDKDLKLIDRRGLQAMLDNPKQRESLIIIDVRKPKPYAEGHIPGAMNIAVIDLRANDARLAEAKTIVTYSTGNPSDLLSWAAAKKLVALGYVGVHDFRGGMDEWLGKGSFKPKLIDTRMEDKADQ